ncbi:MAG: HNH endonuclease [Polyangiaceae bacterium]
MNERYRLGGLEDGQLSTSLSGLVKRENDSLSDLLAHLAELDERQLCVALGYSSLFAYCTEALGFCKSSAGRRIAAARVCRDFPEAFVRVANGELQLAVLCALRPHLSPQNAAELFAACSGKSYEQVEELLAARFPRAAVRDLIRRLPTPKGGTPHIGTKPKDTKRTDIERTETQQVELAPAAFSRESTLPPVAPSTVVGSRTSVHPGALKPLSTDRFSVNFTADGEFKELLEEVRALLSHAEPKGDLLNVMRRGLEALRGDLLKKRFGLGRTPRRVRLKVSAPVVAPQDAGSKHTRYVPAAVAREVYVRDHGRCTFCADGGRRCGERRLLQLDHVIPHAEGGEPTLVNLRLRCRAHNLHAARSHFGTEHVRGATKRAREGTRLGARDAP